jgi:hypothetical protein
MTKTKALEGVQKLDTFVLASLLAVNMYLAQDRRVAQRLFIPGTSPLMPPTTDVPIEGHDRWLSSQRSMGQGDWRLNKWLCIRQDALALAFVCHLGHAIMQKAI